MRPAHDLGGQHVGRALIGLHHLDRTTEVLAVELVALLEQHDHLLEQPADALDLVAVAGDVDLVAAHEDLHRELGLDEAQQLVALTEQTDHEMVARHEDLHGRVRSVAGRRCRFGARSCPERG